MRAFLFLIISYAASNLELQSSLCVCRTVVSRIVSFSGRTAKETQSSIQVLLQTEMDLASLRAQERMHQ